MISPACTGSYAQRTYFQGSVFSASEGRGSVGQNVPPRSKNKIYVLAFYCYFAYRHFSIRKTKPEKMLATIVAIVQNFTVL